MMSQYRLLYFVLFYPGITTYEWIIRRREAKAQREERKIEMIEVSLNGSHITMSLFS